MHHRHDRPRRVDAITWSSGHERERFHALCSGRATTRINDGRPLATPRRAAPDRTWCMLSIFFSALRRGNGIHDGKRSTRLLPTCVQPSSSIASHQVKSIVTVRLRRRRLTVLCAAAGLPAQIEQYGTSVENRPLWAIRIGDSALPAAVRTISAGACHVPRNSPARLALYARCLPLQVLTCGVHAREWISHMMCPYIVDLLMGDDGAALLSRMQVGLVRLNKPAPAAHAWRAAGFLLSNWPREAPSPSQF